MRQRVSRPIKRTQNSEEVNHLNLSSYSRTQNFSSSKFNFSTLNFRAISKIDVLILRFASKVRMSKALHKKLALKFKLSVLLLNLRRLKFSVSQILARKFKVLTF